MLHTGYLFVAPHDAVVDAERVGLGAEESKYVLHLDMAAESYHLIADGVLEAKHDAHGDDHHRQTDGDSDGSNTNGRTTHLSLVALITVDSLSYEKREIHSSSTRPG